MDLLISGAGHAASYVLYLTSHVPGHRFFRTIKMILIKSLHFGCIERHEPVLQFFYIFPFLRRVGVERMGRGSKP